MLEAPSCPVGWACPERDAFFATKKGAPVALPRPAGPIAESHTHLTSLRHVDAGLALARAALAGVRFLVTVVDPADDARDPQGLLASLQGWQRACDETLAAWAAQGVLDALGQEPRTPQVRLLVGCHPHNAKDFDDEARAAMRRLLAEPICCGIGEIGLDYHYDLSPRDVQREVFRAQLELACELDASLSLHVREAHDEAAQIMGEVGLPRTGGAVLHCFDLGYDDAAPFLEMGCVLGIGGAVSFKKNDATRDALARVPRASFVFETDAPYMAPEPLRGTQCEPAYIARTAEFASELRAERCGDDPADTYRDAYELCLRIFDRPAPLGRAGEA